MSPIAIACIAALALQVAALGFWVSVVRGRSHVIFHGQTMHPASPLAKAVRAHGNASEYAGILAGLFIANGLQPNAVGAAWSAHIMLAITVARYLGSVGFLTGKTLNKIHPLKALSALITYFGMVALAIQLLLVLML